MVLNLPYESALGILPFVPETLAHRFARHLARPLAFACDGRTQGYVLALFDNFLQIG